jgi:hypothetical protein
MGPSGRWLSLWKGLMLLSQECFLDLLRSPKRVGCWKKMWHHPRVSCVSFFAHTHLLHVVISFSASLPCCDTIKGDPQLRPWDYKYHRPNKLHFAYTSSSIRSPVVAAQNWPQHPSSYSLPSGKYCRPWHLSSIPWKFRLNSVFIIDV